MAGESTYVIHPDLWEKTSDDEYEYIDEDMAMRVILKQNRSNANSPVWWRCTYSGKWQLSAASLAMLTGDDEMYYLDALDPKENNGSREHYCADTEIFFSENGELKYIPLPTWLIEYMTQAIERDSDAESNAYQWCTKHDGETYESWDTAMHSAWDWYSGHYLNGGQYDYGAVDMLNMALEIGMVTHNCDGSYTITLNY